MRRLLWLSTVCLLLASCSAGSRHTDFVQINPSRGWAYTDTLTLSTADSGAVAALCDVAVRHTADYAWANVWLEATYTGVDGRLCVDTINIPLADPYGRWYGKGFGTSYQVSVRLPGAVRADSLCPIRLRHIMRLDTLRGIDLVGIDLKQP